MGQKVLVIGSGAREHAIAHALLRGDSVSEVTVASGNPGMELDGIRTTQINESNHAAFISFMQHNQYDWAFVGPEVPLIEGLVDDFAAAGIDGEAGQLPDIGAARGPFAGEGTGKDAGQHVILGTAEQPDAAAQTLLIVNQHPVGIGFVEAVPLQTPVGLHVPAEPIGEDSLAKAIKLVFDLPSGVFFQFSFENKHSCLSISWLGAIIQGLGQGRLAYDTRPTA